MKKYLLCLDESGTFQEQEIKNLTNSNRKCIVGGILIEGYNRNWNDTLAALFEKWYTDFPERIQAKLFHATEMGRIPGASKYTEIIFEDMNAAGLDFAIFEDDSNAFISDSNTTYLNVLSEGIAQLLHSLTVKEGKPVELGVIVGRRASTSKNKEIFREGVIADYLYDYKIKERVDIEKAKSESVLLKESNVIVKIKSDKEDDRMILADHVCHFWFTRNSGNYKKICRNGRETIREKLEEYYDNNLIFSFLSSNNDQRISRILNNGTYADALFEYCIGELSAKNRNLVIKNVTKLPNRMIQSQLENLTNYINSIIEVERNLELGKILLKNAGVLIDIFKKKGFNVLKFEIDVKLLLLAVLNHSAELKAMMPIFDDLRPMIGEYTRSSSDISYYLMVQNRYAVFLQDIFEYQKSIDVCDEALEVIESIHDVLSNITQKRRGHKEKFRSVQMGKLLGTEVQAYTSLVQDKPEIFEKAIRVSDLAIKQFEMPMDIQRQYQYRAVLEAAGGKYQSALKWIEKYYDMPWEQYISQKKINIFGVMNLARIADYMSRSVSSKDRKTAEAIINAICGELIEKKKITSEMGYPAVCIYYYTGMGLVDLVYKKGESYLSFVLDYANNHPELVYQILSLKARLRELEAGAKANGKVSTKGVAKFDRLLKAIRKNGLSGAVEEEVNKIEQRMLAI